MRGTASGSGSGVYGDGGSSGTGVYGTTTSGGNNSGVSGNNSNVAGFGGDFSNTDGIVLRLSQGYAGGAPVKATLRFQGGPAPTGACEVGDMYVTNSGVLKICTAAGTPGTWVSVGAQT